jgi:hypothetical protein
MGSNKMTAKVDRLMALVGALETQPAASRFTAANLFPKKTGPAFA